MRYSSHVECERVDHGGEALRPVFPYSSKVSNMLGKKKGLSASLEGEKLYQKSGDKFGLWQV